MTESQIIDLHQRLTKIEEITNNTNGKIIELNNRLFGNEQPGVISKLEARVKDEEEFTARAKGALAFLTTVGIATLAHTVGWLGKVN